MYELDMGRIYHAQPLSPAALGLFWGIPKPLISILSPSELETLQWQLLHRVLTTGTFIHHFYLVASVACPFFMEVAEETLFHAFLDCRLFWPLFAVNSTLFGALDLDLSQMAYDFSILHQEAKRSMICLAKFLLDQAKMTLKSCRNKLAGAGFSDALQVFYFLV